MPLADDRRFYVHEGSFEAYLASFPKEAEPMLRALALAVASRVARHHLLQAGEEMGLIPPGTFAGPVEDLDELARAHLTGVFQALVFAPADPSRHEAVEPLLRVDEHVAALCWESGYFTFATGPSSARTMFEETGSLRALRQALRESPSCVDLELITGRRSLFPASPTIGVGPDTLPRYHDLRRAARGGSIDVATVARVRAEAEREVAERLEPSAGDPSALLLVEAALLAIATAVRNLFVRLGAEEA